MKTSIIIPAFNERDTLLSVVERVERVVLEKEIIVVDDGSTDDCAPVFQCIADKGHRVIRHAVNQGKGTAIRTGLQGSTGDVIAIQDADLELNPEELPRLLQPIRDGRSTVVFGSRFMNLEIRRALSSLQTVRANLLLSRIINLLFGSSLSDVMTCYKIMTRQVMVSLDLTSRGFEIETEMTAKLLKRRHPIIEIPVSYRPRTVEQGKKIRWRHSWRIISTAILIRLFG